MASFPRAAGKGLIIPFAQGYAALRGVRVVRVWCPMRAGVVR